MSGLALLLRCIIIFPLMIDAAGAASLRDERTGTLITLPAGWGMRQHFERMPHAYHLYREPNEAVLDQPDCRAVIVGAPQYETSGPGGYFESRRDPAFLDEQKRQQNADGGRVVHWSQPSDSSQAPSSG